MTWANILVYFPPVTVSLSYTPLFTCCGFKEKSYVPLSILFGNHDLLLLPLHLIFQNLFSSPSCQKCLLSKCQIKNRWQSRSFLSSQSYHTPNLLTISFSLNNPQVWENIHSHFSSVTPISYWWRWFSMDTDVQVASGMLFAVSGSFWVLRLPDPYSYDTEHF